MLFSRSPRHSLVSVNFVTSNNSLKISLKQLESGASHILSGLVSNSDVPILKYRYRWYRPIFVVSASSIGIGKYSRYLPILFKHKINIKIFYFFVV